MKLKPSVGVDAAVLTALQQELETAQQLVLILENEGQALVANQIEAIEQATQVKSQLAVAMTTHRRERLQALQDAGFAASDTSMPLWLAQQTNTTSSTSWQNLLHLMAKVQETNRHNGLVLQALFVQNQAALSALRVHKKSDVYGPNGYKTTTSSFRSILA